ncbi:cadherin domain-containing protein [Stieleria varia]|uniref:Cadherin domain protein n=1 Tax=Stieleria varia TaxID=2528005 RepID=A0A5C5ZTA5_9BACT|nr:cadherin domain-containing protein [Stieleria varia]TWT89433.1 Cadherin domain protein [Stieleria varia]
MKALKSFRRSKRDKLAQQHRRRRQQRFQHLESRQLLASLAGEVWADVNANGVRDPQESAAANVRVYVDVNDDAQADITEPFTTTDTLGRYVLDNLQAGSHVVRIDVSGDSVQTSPRAYFGTANVVGSNATQLLSMTESGVVHPIGIASGSKIDGIIRTNAGVLMGVNSQTNEIVLLDSNTGVQTVLATHQDDLVAGLAYDRVGDRVFAVGRAGLSTDLRTLYEVDQNDGSLTALGAGLTGLSNISDLAYDASANRIVGFDDTTDQFFAFTTTGFGSMLATADRSLNGMSLAFNGTSFVMFDADSPQKTSIITVNPDTGVTSAFINSSSPVDATGLFFGTTGDVARRVTVAATDDLTGLDFGVLSTADRFGTAAFNGMFINELLVGRAFFNTPDEQIIELRGPANSQIPDGTYFVVTHDNSTSNNGEIANVIDLSGQTFGQNGFLVIAPANSPYSIDLDASVLRSTGNDFAGLPGGIYQGLTDSIDQSARSHSFFLVTASFAPTVGSDIDADNNGVADGIFDGWNVHDSISMLSTTSLSTVAYGQIVFAEDNFSAPTVTIPSGANLVVSPGYGYAARAGDSVGSDPDDWIVSSLTQESILNQPLAYELAHSQNEPTQSVFIGRNLDHFGDSNFVGGVRGSVIREPMPGDAEQLPQPAAGVSVHLDINGNGQQDNLIYRVEPDSFPIGADLTNAYPGVTLTATNDTIGFLGLEIEPDAESFIGSATSNRVFSYIGLTDFSDSRKLHAEFYRPVNAVSITAISGSFTSLPTYIRLNAFDADGNLLATTVSFGLINSQRQRLTVSTQTDQIAYIEAFAESQFVDANGNVVTGYPFGLLDSLEYRQREPSTVTDANGNFEIENLPRANYSVRYETPLPADINDPPMVLIGAQTLAVPVTRYENYIVGPNRLPEGAPLTLTLEENQPLGLELGAISGVDPDGSTVSYRIDDPNSPLAVDPVTGVVSVVGVLDFEATPTLEIPVILTDDLGAEVAVPVRLTLVDVNEAPIVVTSPFSVPEGTANGTAVGQVEAFDPDTQQNQTLTYTLISSIQPPLFSIHPQSGLLTIADSAQLDFETRPFVDLEVEVSDSGSPSLTTTITQRVNLINQNDAPVISTTSLFVSENLPNIGRVVASDPDVGQTLRYVISGGSDANLFQIDNQGNLRTANGVTLDFEQRATYFVSVDVIDNGTPPLADSADITVTLFDVNETAVISPTTVLFPENTAAGTQVAQFSLTDPENTPADYGISLLPDLDGDLFQFDGATNTLSVAPGANLDFETRRSLNLVFEVVDNTGGSPTNTQSIRVELTDSNDDPQILSSEINISENAPAGSSVQTLLVTDPDVNDDVTTTITGGTAAALFTLDPDTHVLSVADGVTLDFESGEFMTLNVMASDGNGGTSERVINIVLNDVNEPPQFGGTLSFDPVSSGETFTYVIPNDFIVDPEGNPFQVTIFDAQGKVPSWLTFDPEVELESGADPVAVLTGLATPDDVGQYPLTLRAFEFGPLELFSRLDFTIEVQLGSTPYFNQSNPMDVDRNGEVAALDALKIINFIGRNGSGQSPSVETVFPGFVDTNGNNIVTALDALGVINELRFRRAAGERELVSLSDVQIDDKDEANDSALLELLDSAMLF